MASLVLSGAQDACSISTRHSISTLLRNFAYRTPILCRFLRQPEDDGAALPVLGLPENLLVYIFYSAGVSTTLNASLSCRSAHDQVWQNSTFWLAFLQLLGASHASLRIEAGHSHRCDRSSGTAKAYRDIVRHLLFGIDVLVGCPVRLEPGVCSMPFVNRRRDGNTDFKLEDARRAILAMMPEDGEALIQRATDSIVELLRKRSCGESELSKAEDLLEAVASRCELFSTGQMLDMLGAHQKADEALTLESIPKIPPNVSTRTEDAARPSRRARRVAAVAA